MEKHLECPETPGISQKGWLWGLCEHQDTGTTGCKFQALLDVSEQPLGPQGRDRTGCRDSGIHWDLWNSQGKPLWMRQEGFPGSGHFAAPAPPQSSSQHSRVLSGRVFCTKMWWLDRKKNVWLPVNYWSAGLDSPHSLCSILPSSLKKSPPKQSFVMSHCLLWHLELGVFPISAFGICPCSPSSAVIPALGRDSRTMGKAGMGQGEEPLTLQGLGWLGDTQEVQGIQISFLFLFLRHIHPCFGTAQTWPSGTEFSGFGCVQ